MYVLPSEKAVAGQMLSLGVSCCVDLPSLLPGHHHPEWVLGWGVEVVVNIEHNVHLHMFPRTLFPLEVLLCTPVKTVGCSTTCEAFIRHGLVRSPTSLQQNRRMRGAAILLLAAVALASGQTSAMKEIMEGIDMYNFRARCWGEANVDRQIAALETAKKICMQVFLLSRFHTQNLSTGGFTTRAFWFLCPCEAVLCLQEAGSC